MGAYDLETGVSFPERGDGFLHKLRSYGSLRVVGGKGHLALYKGEERAGTISSAGVVRKGGGVGAGGNGPLV